MTIDHVRELDVVLSDASQAQLRARRRASAQPARHGRRRWKAASTAGCPGIVEQRRRAIAAGFPQFWRRACGYRLDRLAARRGRFRPGEVRRRLGGDARAWPPGRGRPGAQAGHTVIAVGHFTVGGRRDRRDRGRAVAATRRGRADGPTILDLAAQKIEYADAGPHPRRRPRGAALRRRSPATTRPSSSARWTRLTALWTQPRPRLPHPARPSPRPSRAPC